MEVYRITLAKYAHNLIAPGTEARWNSKGKFVIYTAGSRALACLENLVHRDGEGLQNLFKVLIINIPNTVSIKEIDEKELPAKWTKMENSGITKFIGNNWLQSLGSCVLKVSSAIIANEYNYLINPAHEQFKKIKIKAIEDFVFDSRLKK